MKSSELIEQMCGEVRQQISTVKLYFVHQNDATLNFKSGPKKWSVLECLAHLNSYAAYYLPEFEKAVAQAQKTEQAAQSEIVSTWLGRKSIAAVHPDMMHKKYKAISRHNHVNSQVERNELDTFLNNQQRLLQILNSAAMADLNNTKVRIEIMKLLKLGLGEFFQFFVYHQGRHILQAQRVLDECPVAGGQLVAV